MDFYCLQIVLSELTLDQVLLVFLRLDSELRRPKYRNLTPASAESRSAAEANRIEAIVRWLNNMITFVRTTPFPSCRYCGKRMDYYVIGLPDAKHAHSECEGRAMANDAIDVLKRKLMTPNAELTGRGLDAES